MGSLLLAAGEKGKRHCLPNASIMIHRTRLFVKLFPINVRESLPVSEPSGGASGQATDIAIHAKEILRIRQLLTSIYQRHCSRTAETKEKAISRFGNYCHAPQFIISNFANVPLEKALERDYYMTGWFFSLIGLT